MRTKRNPSAENRIKKKQKLNTEDIIDLTSEDAETIESGFEELNNADNPQAIKKTVPKTDKQNKSPKEAKRKINTKNDDKPTKKPNRKEFKKEKPKLQLNRKSHNNCSFYVAAEKTKNILELMRHDNCPKKKKETLLRDLFKYSKPHLQTMVYSPDTICIVQYMLKLGTPEIRTQVINELIKHVPKMMFCQYACSSVKNMLKQGDAKQRKIIINSLKGKVYRYTLHTNSAKIMDLMYTTYATPKQQNAMMRELYGASGILCDSSNVSLTDILENSPDTADYILAKTKDHIRKFVLKQKTSMQTTLVHNLIYEYIKYAGEEESDELITLLKKFPIELFYTSNGGCHLAMNIIWSANAKEYKSILKKIKATAATRGLATSDHGYLILFALFDTVPDTVLVKKTIIPEILKNLEAIATNKNGRRFIIALAAWRGSFFHPQDIDLTKKGESFKQCKKNDGGRIKKILNAISEGFLQHIQNNPKFWFSSLEMAAALQEILLSCNVPKLKEAITSVANFIIDPKNKLKDEILGKVPVYEHSGVNVVLREIIGHDKVLAINNETTFSEVLSSIITTDTLKLWVKCNRACYLLVEMMDSEVELAVENIKSLFSTTIMDLLKKQQFAGAEVLVTKLNSIATNE